VAEITDTEIVAPAMRRVNLGALSLRVPPSPTIHYMFFFSRMVKKFQGGQITEDDIETMYDETVEFLRLYNKDVDEDKLRKTCLLSELITFYSDCFGQADDEETEVEEAPPPRAVRRGTTGRTRAKRSRSASST
jgi:hypothetical protein